MKTPGADVTRGPRKRVIKAKAKTIRINTKQVSDPEPSPDQEPRGIHIVFRKK